VNVQKIDNDVARIAFGRDFKTLKAETCQERRYFEPDVEALLK
jgi:hypothetical protein